jgi:hypothetical protein
MRSQWQAVMKDTISDVLETMFFTMVDFYVNGGQAGEPYDFESRIVLSNEDERATISVRIAGPFGRMLTAGFLGLKEEQISADDMEDTLKELTNMVGGGYLARIGQENWKLGIPKAARAGAEAQDGTVADGELSFSCFGDSAGTVCMRFSRGRAQ